MIGHALGRRLSIARWAAAGLLLALAPQSGRAAPLPDTLSLSLDQAVQRALDRGEEMRGAKAIVEQTEGRIREALSRALPQISGQVTYDRKLSSIFEGSVSDTSAFAGLLEDSPFAAQNTWTLGVTGEQLLWSSGKVGSALRAAKAANRSAHAGERETAGGVALQVKTAYYDAVYAQRLVEIAQDGLTQAREHLRQVQNEQRVGAKSEFDLLRAEVDAANQEPGVLAARRGAATALLGFKRLVNLPLDQPVAMTSPLSFPDDRVPVVTEPALSVEQRPALAAADADVEARRHLVGVYRGQHWPDLYVSSTLQEQAFPRSFFPRSGQFARNWDVLLRIEVPIFSGFRTEGQVQQARADLAAAQASRDRLREEAAIEATDARAELDRSLSALMARRKTVTQAKRAFELASVRYSNGMSTQVEVSDARLQYQTAEVSEVSATRDYMVALARLERAIGYPVPVTPMTLEDATRSLIPEGTR